MTEPKQPAAAPTVGELLDKASGWDYHGIPLSNRAYALREATNQRFREESIGVGLARDDASRDASSHEQQAKAAEVQVTTYEREIKTLNAELARARTRLATTERDTKRFDDVEPVEDAREAITLLQVRLENATVRRDRAADEAIGLREDAAGAKATVIRLDADLKATGERAAQADRLLDPMEARAHLLTRSEEIDLESSFLSEEVKTLRAAGKTAEAEKVEEKVEILEARSSEYFEKASRLVVNKAALTELEAELLPFSPDLQQVLRQPMKPDVALDPSLPTPSAEPTDPTSSPDLIDDDLIIPRSPTEPADADVSPVEPKPVELDFGGTEPKSERGGPFDERQVPLDEGFASVPEDTDHLVSDLDEPLLSSPSGDEFGFADPVDAAVDEDPAPFDLP